jgi:hypothetical protein
VERQFDARDVPDERIAHFGNLFDASRICAGEKALGIDLPGHEVRAMKETIEQYKQRIQGYASGKEPLKVQTRTGAKLEKLIKGIPKAELRKRPAPHKWSVAEILAHLEDAEIVIGYRMRAILGDPGTPIQAFDQEKWAAAENYAKRDPHEALAVFQALRATNVRLLKSLKPEQWKHFGMHAERGEETIERITVMTAGHDINHLKQIEAIVVRGSK